MKHGKSIRVRNTPNEIRVQWTPSTELRLANHTQWPIHIHNHFQSTHTSSFLIPFFFSHTLSSLILPVSRFIDYSAIKKSIRECSSRFVINKSQCKLCISFTFVCFSNKFFSLSAPREFINAWDFDVFIQSTFWWMNMLHLRVTFRIDLLMCDIIFFQKILFLFGRWPVEWFIHSFAHCVGVLQNRNLWDYGFFRLILLFIPCPWCMQDILWFYPNLKKKNQKLTKRAIVGFCFVCVFVNGQIGAHLFECG